MEEKQGTVLKNENKESKNLRLRANIALLFVAFLWGGGFIAAKGALTGFSPFTLVTIRFLGSGIIMLIIFNKHMKYIPRHTWFNGIAIGLFMFAGMTLQTIGINHTTASKQAFLVASYTVFVPFLSWAVTKKKPSLLALIAGLLTVVGVGVLSLTGSFTIEFGDALSLLFALVFGAQIVYTAIFVQNVNMMQFTTIQFITGGILALCAALLFEAPPTALTTLAIGSAAYLLILNTTVAFTVQNIAQRYTSDTQASVILSLQSIFGVFLAILILHEAFTFRMGLGAIIIFCAVLISIFDRR